jgi:hypothetical protein
LAVSKPRGGKNTFYTARVKLTRAASPVDVVDPSKLSSANIVKIDIEGGEAAVLAALDFCNTALVLVEFQNRRRLAMQEVLAQNFVAILDDPRHVVPKPAQAYEPEVPIKVREWISPALASPDLVLEAQPPA